MFALLSASSGFAPIARTAVLRGAPLALRGGRSLSMSAEDDIKSIITAMAKDQNALGEDPTRAEADAFMAKYYTPNCITIRPSGNPLSADGFAEMISMDDVKASLHELVDITDVKIFAGGNGATRNSAQFLRNSLTPHPSRYSRRGHVHDAHGLHVQGHAERRHRRLHRRLREGRRRLEGDPRPPRDRPAAEVSARFETQNH